VELTHLQFAADVAALELGRSAALFEVTSKVGHVRAQNRKLHAFNATFMTALTTFYTFHRLFDRLQRDGETQVMQACAPLYAIVAEALQTTPSQDSLDTMQLHLQTALAQARAQIDGAPVAHAQRIDFDTVCELLERFARDMSRFHEVYFSLAHDTPLEVSTPQAYAPKTPPALVSPAARAPASAWPCWPWAPTSWPGPTPARHADGGRLLRAGLVLAASHHDDPPGADGLIAMPLSLVPCTSCCCTADGFPMLVLGFAPFLAVGLYLMTNPAGWAWARRVDLHHAGGAAERDARRRRGFLNRSWR
jgi:hypothetical protein